MIYIYIASQKFDSVRISVLGDIKKYEETSIKYIFNDKNIYFS